MLLRRLVVLKRVDVPPALTIPVLIVRVLVSLRQKSTQVLGPLRGTPRRPRVLHIVHLATDSTVKPARDDLHPGAVVAQPRAQHLAPRRLFRDEAREARMVEVEHVHDRRSARRLDQDAIPRDRRRAAREGDPQGARVVWAPEGFAEAGRVVGRCGALGVGCGLWVNGGSERAGGTYGCASGEHVAGEDGDAAFAVVGVDKDGAGVRGAGTAEEVRDVGRVGVVALIEGQNFLAAWGG